MAAHMGGKPPRGSWFTPWWAAGLLLVVAAGLAGTAALLPGRATAASAPEAQPATEFVLNGDAAAGEAVYREHCVSCHGEKGDGRGPDAEYMYPPPGNYRDPELMAELTDEFIYTIIKKGGAAVGKSSQMEAWEKVLSDQQIRDVAAYIRRLASRP